MNIQYFGDRITITGTSEELRDFDFSNHATEGTLTVGNENGECFALAAKLGEKHDVEIVNEDAEPVKEKKPRKKKVVMADTDAVPGEGKPKRPRLTKADKMKILERKAEGKDDADIAVELALDVSQVKRVKP